MKKPVWLDRAVCLAIHEMVLSQHGGLAGVRDEGLLESALEKPPNLLAYGSPTLAELAASYAAGIILNHPFIDGNKRTGFMLAATFLELNGQEFTASEESVVENTLALAENQFTEDLKRRYIPSVEDWIPAS
jgi:death-on-curing protein